MGSLVGFTAYAWLLRVAPISLVVTHQYVNPLVAIALGMLFLGERPSPWTLAGALVVIAAVYIAVRAESPRRTVGTRTDAAAKLSGVFARPESARADSGLAEPTGDSTCDRRAARNSSRSDRVRIPDGLPSLATTTAPVPPDRPS